MSDLGDLIAERSARHRAEAKSKRGADLSYKEEDGVHFVTWHTQDGYDFLSTTPDSNLALWHSIFTEDDALDRVEYLLERARDSGLVVYNDLPKWRRAAPSNLLPVLAGLVALGGLLYFYSRLSASDAQGSRWLPRRTGQNDARDDVDRESTFATDDATTDVPAWPQAEEPAQTRV